MRYLPLLLFGLAGIFVGGVVALLRQGASRAAVLLVGLMAVLAAAGGLFWLIPGDG